MRAALFFGCAFSKTLSQDDAVLFFCHPTGCQTKPAAVFDEGVVQIAPITQPAVHLLFRHAEVALCLGEFFEVWIKVGQKEHDECQA